MNNKEKENRKAWLATLVVGDEVAVTRNSREGARYNILKIERLTTTQFVMKDDIHRYRREDGSVVGKGYSEIHLITPEIRENVEQAKLVSWLSGLTRNHRVTASLQQLRAMKTAYDEASK